MVREKDKGSPFGLMCFIHVDDLESSITVYTILQYTLFSAHFFMHSKSSSGKVGFSLLPWLILCIAAAFFHAFPETVLYLALASSQVVDSADRLTAHSCCSCCPDCFCRSSSADPLGSSSVSSAKMAVLGLDALDRH